MGIGAIMLATAKYIESLNELVAKLQEKINLQQDMIELQKREIKAKDLLIELLKNRHND